MHQTVLWKYIEHHDIRESILEVEIMQYVLDSLK